MTIAKIGFRWIGNQSDSVESNLLTISIAFICQPSTVPETQNGLSVVGFCGPYEWSIVVLETKLSEVKFSLICSF